MYARVYQVDEIHVTALIVSDGSPPAISTSAKGLVNSGGWSMPSLSPWIYIVPPADGILDRGKTLQ
jgi:hypothetical protein